MDIAAGLGLAQDGFIARSQILPADNVNLEPYVLKLRRIACSTRVNFGRFWLLAPRSVEPPKAAICRGDPGSPERARCGGL